MSNGSEIRPDAPADQESGNASGKNKKYKPLLIAAVALAIAESLGVILWEMSEGLHGIILTLSHWGSLLCFGFGPWVALYEGTKNIKWPAILSGITILVSAIAAFTIWPIQNPSPQSLYWAQFTGVILLAMSGWIPFTLTNIRLKRAERRITECLAVLDAKPKAIISEKQIASNAPFKISDDFEFNPIYGYYVERNTGLRVCATCLFPPTGVVVHLHHDFEMDEYEGQHPIWRCGQCHRSYSRDAEDDPPPF